MINKLINEQTHHVLEYMNSFILTTLPEKHENMEGKLMTSLYMQKYAVHLPATFFLTTESDDMVTLTGKCHITRNTQKY